MALFRGFGSGLFLSGSALYFTRVVGLGVAEVGLGLSCAAAVGLAAMIPVGRLADRFGGKRVFAALLLVHAGMLGCYLLVDSFATFLSVAVVSAVAERGMAGVIGLLVHGLVSDGLDVPEHQRRVLVRSYSRAMGNIGTSLGALCAGGALYLDVPEGYTALIAAHALVLLVALGMMGKLVVLQAERTEGRRPSVIGNALCDRRYLTATFSNGISSLHYQILGFGMPLWVANWTDAPKWGISLGLILNTVIVVLFQVRAGQVAGSLAGAAKAAQIAGVLLCMGCGLLALMGLVPMAGALVVLVLWAVVHSLGEVLQASSGFCLSFELAPDNAQGEYQSTFALGEGFARVIAPSLLSFTALSWGAVGWGPVGFLLLGSGVLSSIVAVRWRGRGAMWDRKWASRR